MFCETTNPIVHRIASQHTTNIFFFPVFLSLPAVQGTNFMKNRFSYTNMMCSEAVVQLRDILFK